MTSAPLPSSPNRCPSTRSSMSSRPSAIIGWKLWSCRAKINHCSESAIGFRPSATGKPVADSRWPKEAAMENGSIRILLIDDDEEDYILTRVLPGEIQGLKIDLTLAKNYRARTDSPAPPHHDPVLP